MPAKEGRNVRKMLLGMILWFLTACGSQTVKGGSMGVSYRHPVHAGKRYSNLLVFVDFKEDKGLALFAELTMCEELHRHGRLHGVEIVCAPKSALNASQKTAADGAIEISMTGIGSKFVMTPGFSSSFSTDSMKSSHGQTSDHGTSEWASFSVTLVDLSTNEPAWAASVFARSGMKGDVGDVSQMLAKEVVIQLRRSALLPSRLSEGNPISP